MLNFDPKTGFEVSEVTEIREQVAQEWINAFKEQGKPDLNTDPETPQGQLIDSQTAAIHQKDSELAFLAQMFNPLTSAGKWQEALGKIYFINRKPAISSTCECVLTGRNGTVIPAGAQIRSSYDQTFWSLDESVTIDETERATGNFTCTEGGAIEAGIGTLDQIVTAISGWDSVTNEIAAIVGQTEETQAAFENRRYQSVALNSRGTVQSVFARVADVQDVIAVYAIDNKTHEYVTVDSYTLKPHSIYVAVIGGEDKDIANAIYNSVSAGCDYNGNTAYEIIDENTGAHETVLFERPTELDVHIKVTLDNGTELPNNYEQVIKNALHDNFYGEDSLLLAGEPILRVVMNDEVYASRFLPSVLNAGINNVLGVQISLDGETWGSQIHIPIDKNPVLLDENIQIIVLEDTTETTDENDTSTSTDNNSDSNSDTDNPDNSTDTEQSSTTENTGTNEESGNSGNESDSNQNDTEGA